MVVFCVAAVGIKAVLDDLYFGRSEEGTLSFVDFVRKVNDEPETEEGKSDWDEALNYLLVH